MIHSWGQYPRVDARRRDRWWVDEMMPKVSHWLPVGLGRSYGDSATLDCEVGELVSMRRCRRLISYDPESRVLCAEAGCSVGDILAWSLPRGLFLPVVPGTRYVTLGGAVANDIHGKNHHRNGTFGSWVREFGLQRSDSAETVFCREGEELFGATVGGLGLTGLITEVKVELEEIDGCGLVEEESQVFADLDEGCDRLEELDGVFPMTVAWIDMGSSKAGSGVAMGGRFVEGAAEPLRGARLAVPLQAPGFVLNRWSIGLFNRLYRAMRASGRRTLSGASYFFPLDGVGNWNRLYGKRGFLQYQFVVPEGEREALREVQRRILKSGERAFLSVLKRFGEKASPGWLSFPFSGWTLAMDFPMKGASTLALMNELDEVVRDAHGRLYPAKDARMPAGLFRESYQRWGELEGLRDPAILSAFWQRVAKNGGS